MNLSIILPFAIIYTLLFIGCCFFFVLIFQFTNCDYYLSAMDIIWWKPFRFWHFIELAKENNNKNTNRITNIYQQQKYVANGQICIWNATVTITAVIEMCVCVCTMLHRALVRSRLFSPVSVSAHFPQCFHIYCTLFFSRCTVNSVNYLFSVKKKHFIFVCTNERDGWKCVFVTHSQFVEDISVLIYLRLVIYKS